MDVSKEYVLVQSQGEQRTHRNIASDPTLGQNDHINADLMGIGSSRQY